MTNATVAEVKEVGDQRELKVSYRQGEGEQKTEGSQTIYAPEDLSVVRMEKASDRSVLHRARRLSWLSATTPAAARPRSR